MGRAWYVKARKSAFPYGVRLVSGPFEEMGDAFGECRRLRDAGLYPDATLQTIIHRAKSLPERKPRTRPPSAPNEEPTVPDEFNLRQRAERERLAAEMKTRARALGASVVVENWDGEPDVTISTPSLHATIWCVSVQGEMPIISWYGAAYPLRAVPGAWTAEQVNSSHQHKATSLPRTYAELFDALEIGICAAVDGSAFDLPAV